MKNRMTGLTVSDVRLKVLRRFCNKKFIYQNLSKTKVQNKSWKIPGGKGEWQMIYYCGEFVCQHYQHGKCNNPANFGVYGHNCVILECSFVFCRFCRKMIECKTGKTDIFIKFKWYTGKIKKCYYIF